MRAKYLSVEGTDIKTHPSVDKKNRYVRRLPLRIHHCQSFRIHHHRHILPSPYHRPSVSNSTMDQSQPSVQQPFAGIPPEVYLTILADAVEDEQRAMEDIRDLPMNGEPRFSLST